MCVHRRRSDAVLRRGRLLPASSGKPRGVDCPHRDRRPGVMITTPETKTPFPGRMHRLSVDTHTRRAGKALSDLAGEAAGMALALEQGRAIEPEDARKLGELAGMICA